MAKLPERSLGRADQRVTGDGVRVTLRADRTGTAHLYAGAGDRALGEKTVELTAGRSVTVTVPVEGGKAGSLLAAFDRVRRRRPGVPGQRALTRGDPVHHRLRW